MPTTSTRQHVTPTRARQGRMGWHMLLVLVASLALVILGFLAAYGWHARELASTNPSIAKSQANAQKFDMPPPAGATKPQPVAPGQRGSSEN